MIHNLDPFIKQHDNYLVANCVNHKLIPVIPLTNDPIRGDKLRHLMSFDEAENLLSRNVHDEVMFYYTRQCPLIVVNMDNCLENGVLIEPFRTILTKHPTYTEISRSGNGLHAYYQCSNSEKAGLDNKAVYYLDDNNKAIKAEVIANKHLCCLTGNTFEETDEFGVRPIGDLSTTIAQHLPHRPQPHDRIQLYEPRDTSLEDVREALSFLNADMNHDSWLKIGMAIHSQWPDNQGRELFEIWSRQGESFHIRDFHASWKSFSLTHGSITLAFLFAESVKHGYRQPSNVYDIRSKSCTSAYAVPSQQQEKAHNIPVPPVLFLRIKQLFELKPAGWLVEKLIPSRAIGQLFGATQSYKSFIALHLALSITQGQDFFGFPIKQGQVLYMCGERIEDFGKRVLGWQEHYKANVIESNDIIFTKGCYDITSPYKTGQFLAYLQWLQDNEGFDPDLIIIDTLSKAFHHNENSNEDIGLFLKALAKIRDATSASILLIHHSGHSDTSRSRGSSRLPDDLDFCIRSVRQKDQPETILSVTKQKDEECIETIPILMQSINTSMGSTLVATGLEHEQFRPRDIITNECDNTSHYTQKPSRNHIKAQKLLIALIKERQSIRSNSPPPQISIADFKKLCLQRHATTYNNWARFKQDMIFHKLIRIEDNCVIPVPPDT